MSFTIIVQTNQSERNRLDKTLVDLETLTGTLRGDTSIIDPVIIVEGSLETLRQANYLTVPSFGRSYFINNIRSMRNGLVELSCHVDVLSSFKTQIRANSAIIHRSERNWDLYINDGSLVSEQGGRVTTQQFGGSFVGAHSFVLVLAG